MVQLDELGPLLTVGDLLKGDDHGQAYQISDRELITADKRIYLPLQG